MSGASDTAASAAATIRFDHRGALELARSLHQAAVRLGEVTGRRSDAGRRALESWTGPRAEEYAARLAAEVDEAESIGVSLRAEADGWARAWAEATDERAGVDRGGVDLDWWAPVAVPVAPGYEATGAAGGGRP